MGSLYLRTNRMDLREFTVEDAENLVALDSDPAVMRFISGGAPTPMQVVRDEVLPKLMRYYERCKGVGAWAAIERQTGAFVGWFHLRPFEENPGVLELGYRFAQSAWGRGFATEGSRALVVKGFGELGAERIVAKTMYANRGSIRVMEKIGLEFDKEFVAEDFPGEDKAAVLYSLTREEYDTPRFRR